MKSQKDYWISKPKTNRSGINICGNRYANAMQASQFQFGEAEKLTRMLSWCHLKFSFSGVVRCYSLQLVLYVMGPTSHYLRNNWALYFLICNMTITSSSYLAKNYFVLHDTKYSCFKLPPTFCRHIFMEPTIILLLVLFKNDAFCLKHPQ